MPEVTRSSVRGLVPVGFGTGRAKAARADPALSSESRGKVRRLGGRLRLQAVDKKDLRCYPFGQKRDINFKKDSEVGSACRPSCACGTLGQRAGRRVPRPSKGRQCGMSESRGRRSTPRGLSSPRRPGPGVSAAC